MSDSSLIRPPPPAVPPAARRLLTRLALIVATALILAALAPIRTATLAWPPRIALFLFATLVWEAAVAAAATLLRRRTPDPASPNPAPAFMTVLLLAAIPATALILAAQLATGLPPGNLPSAAAESLLLGLLVAFARRGLRRPTPPIPAPTPDAARVATPATPAPPSPAAAFLRRHAPALPGRLLALQAEDHYLRIHSDAGSHLILMRLRDAVAELGEAAGWQPHRSYWLATDAGGHAVRRGQAWQIHLPTGLTIPVSKTATPALRAAGYAAIP